MKTLIAIATLFVLGVPTYAQNADQQKYCAYLQEQARASAIQLRTPSIVAGISQPTAGTPAQIYSGASNSISADRRASITLQSAAATCALYASTENALLRVQTAPLALNRDGLQHRLELLQQAELELRTLISDASKRVDAQNLTRPTLYALQKTQASLVADRAATELALASIYVPSNLPSTPIRVMVSEKQVRERNVQQTNDRLIAAQNWDFQLAAGARKQIVETAGVGRPAGGYATVEFTWNLGRSKVNSHLDQAATNYADWTSVQEGDVARGAVVLKEQIERDIAAQQTSLADLQAQAKVIDRDLAELDHADTTAALVFALTLKSDRVMLRVNIQDTQWRLDSLTNFLRENF